MYFLDPAGGRRRRASVRDNAAGITSDIGDALDTTGRNIADELRGLAASARARFKREPVSDGVLAERVRSKLGRNISHPGEVEVEVLNGIIVLRGPVLKEEVDRLISCVSSVAGVKEVRSEVEVHETAGDIAALQEPRRPGERPEIPQKNWPPAFRVFMGSLGVGVLALAGRSGAAKFLTTPVGLGVLAKAVTNADFAKLAGFAAGKTRELASDISSSRPVQAAKEMFH